MRLFQKTGSAKAQTATTAAALPSGKASGSQRGSQIGSQRDSRSGSQREEPDWSQLHDRALCQKLNAGAPDEQSRAFSVIYDRYELMIRNYVMKQLNYSEEDSVEVIGDTWLVFWRERVNFTWRDDAQAENPLKSWLYGIARNRIKTKVRQNQKERENIASVPLEVVSNFIEARLEGSTDNSAGSWAGSSISNRDIDEPDIEMISNRLFNQIMKQLSPTEQQIVTLRYYKGLTYTEISQQMERTSGAVRTAHTRLIQKLRQKLNAPDLDVSTLDVPTLDASANTQSMGD